LDDIPLDWLYGETVVLDIPKAEKEPISAEGFENATPEIKEGDIVLVHTG
jgi:kynurenine formamidase